MLALSTDTVLTLPCYQPLGRRYTHHFFVVVIIVVMMHAASAWYFLVGGLCLYALDHAIRFVNAATKVEVTRMIVRPLWRTACLCLSSHSSVDVVVSLHR